MKLVGLVLIGACAVIMAPVGGLLLLGGGSTEHPSCTPDNTRPAAIAIPAPPCQPPGDDGGTEPPVVDDVGALIERAQAFVDSSAAGLPDPFYGETDYYRWCARLAARIHGHAHAGYRSAYVQWRDYERLGIAVTDGSPPPVGALLFYASPPSGHVAVYLGDGRVVSNDVLDAVTGRTGGIYIVEQDELTDGAWRLPYLGWAPPHYSTPRTSSPAAVTAHANAPRTATIRSRDLLVRGTPTPGW